MIRKNDGRAEKTSLCIVDAQSVPNSDPAAQKGYDSGKHISGIKRHIGVDTNGLPHAIHVTTANVTDRAGALAMIARYRERLTKVTKFLVDGSYTGPTFATNVKELLSAATVEVAKRSELHTFAVIPKRWVVERDFGWLEKQRRLARNFERKIKTSEQMVVITFVAIFAKRF